MRGTSRPDRFFVDLRRYANDGLTAQQIALKLNVTKGVIIGLCDRKKLKLKNAPGHWNEKSPRAKKPALPAIVQRVIITKAIVQPINHPTCMWAGCAEYSIARGKPYCTEHHLKAGGLFNG